MDDAFFGRVMRTGLVVTALVGLMIWCALGARCAASFAAGALIALAVLECTIRFANAIARPPDERHARNWPFVVLHVAKYAVVGLVFWVLISRVKVDPAWLAGGLAVPMVVILLKFAGQAAHNKVSEPRT